MYIVDDTKVTLYADWGDYFLHLDSITQIDHFDGIMKRPCPTFVEILTNNDFEKAGIMSMNGKETMGIGMDVKVDWNGKIKPAALPYHPSVADGIVKLTEKSLKLYTEISKNCPPPKTLERPPGSCLGRRNKINYGFRKDEIHSS